MLVVAHEVGELLHRKGLTLGVVESATGGLISHLITDVPGSSDYYKGSVTAYSNEVKMKLIGVSEDTLRRHGAVSAQVAEEMAEGAWQIPESPGRAVVAGKRRWVYSTWGWRIRTGRVAGNIPFPVTVSRTSRRRRRPHLAGCGNT